MDKKSPHNNLPQGIPPPGSEQHAAEVADFSAIKQGFEANFDGLTPPKFLWDTIDQELQAELPTDAPEQFSSIKEGFESSFLTQSAPSFPWDALEKEPAPTNEDYSTIKQSFEHQYGSVIVPLFSWDDLSQRMEQEALEADHPDQYSRVKEGYAAYYAAQHPVATVWQNILRQLHPRTAWWQAHRQKVGGALLALGMLGASLWTWSTQRFEEAAPPTVLAINDQRQAQPQTQSLTPYAPSTKVERHPWHTAWAEEESATASQSQEASLLGASPLVEEAAQQPNASTNPLFVAAAPNEQVNTPTVSGIAPSSSTLTQHDQGDEISTTEIDQVATNHFALQAIRQEEQEQLATTTTPTVPASAITAGTVLHTLPTEPELLAQPQTKQTPLVLPSMESEWAEGILAASSADAEADNQLLAAQWQAQIDNPSMDFVERNSFSTTRQALKGKRLRIELGAVGRFGTSMLLRPKRHRDENDVRDFGPSTALGVMGQIYLGKNDAFTLSGYPFVVTWHGLQKGGASEGFQRTDVEFAFMEVAMGYQRVLWHYSLIGEMPSRVYARLELGAAWVTRSNTRLNRGPRQHNAWYADLQYSTGLSFGTTHTIGNVVVDYGITGNLGLNSIVAPSGHPSLPYPTRLFQAGGYLSLRYLLTPRLAPSKRMRQFDWSPPFYIEEPGY